MREFEEHVRRALDALPPDLAVGLEDVAVEDEHPGEPDLEQETRITVLHELAYYLGLGGERLDQLGYR